MRLIFLGPPGAGKGTLALVLMEREKVTHLSSGNLLREAVRRGDPIGREAARCMQSGALVPDRLVTDLVLRRIGEFGKADPFALDGFPRTVEQARVLDEELARAGHAPVDLTVGFQVSPSTMVKRLQGRRVCEACAANYHLERLPPQRPGICDRCGGNLKARPDDRPETVMNRLAVYEKETAPLMDFYRAQGKLRVLSGEAVIEEQYQALLALLKKEGLAG
ncbi:MAG: nucleoside monophosphate kinase [Candidatus Omnitrophica bacterium]|nr:nucleoside monophosphate kinase [Candidatus Omnitrophota bacterium]